MWFNGLAVYWFIGLLVLRARCAISAKFEFDFS